MNRLTIRFLCSYCFSPITTRLGSFPGDSVVKNLPANTGNVGSILGGIDTLEKELATCSGVLAWEIPWTGGLVGCSPWGRRVGHDSAHTVQQHARLVGQKLLRQMGLLS